MTGGQLSHQPNATGAVELHITGTDLPGRDCGDGYANVHVGIQIRRDADQVVPADADRVTFTTGLEIVERDGVADFKGPAVQGRPGSRFVYLTWGNPGADGQFTMFRRAKLMLDEVDRPTIDAARQSGVLRAVLALTDAQGLPRCAAVRPPDITWSGTPASA